jgi:hypothetical protein
MPCLAFIRDITASHAYYCFFLLTLFQIASSPPGTQACTLDIKKFHCTCPALPDHKPFLVVQGTDGSFYVDHCTPFGSASASSNAGMIGCAITDIMISRGIKPVKRYEDDFKPLHSPIKSISNPDNSISFLYVYDKSEMLCRIDDLNVPWHSDTDKGDPEFVFITTFVGFLWDLPRKLVSLPDKKRSKYLHRVDVFIKCFSGGRCCLHEVEEIHGILCHHTFVHQEGCSRLPSHSNFMATFKGDRYSRQYPSDCMINDLKWWLEELAKPNLSRQLFPQSSPKDIHLFVDVLQVNPM